MAIGFKYGKEGWRGGAVAFKKGRGGGGGTVGFKDGEEG